MNTEVKSVVIRLTNKEMEMVDEQVWWKYSKREEERGG